MAVNKGTIPQLDTDRRSVVTFSFISQLKKSVRIGPYYNLNFIIVTLASRIFLKNNAEKQFALSHILTSKFILFNLYVFVE